MGHLRGDRWLSLQFRRLVRWTAPIAVLALAFNILSKSATTRTSGPPLPTLLNHQLDREPRYLLAPAPEEPPGDPNATLLDVLSKDPTLSRFTAMIMQYQDFTVILNDTSQPFTIYAPTDAALELSGFRYPDQAPSFYDVFFMLHHLAAGVVSYADLTGRVTTVGTAFPHDAFRTNMQRISTRDDEGRLMFNRKAEYIGRPLDAANGVIHRLSEPLFCKEGVFELESVADLLRQAPELQTFRRALIATDMAVQVNDTQSHLSQTLFVPTDAAFIRLGSRINSFLFGPWGRAYLTALVQYHIVMNSTLFTDTYFLPARNGQVAMGPANETLALDTLLPGHALETRIINSRRLHGNRQTISVGKEGGKVVVQRPDRICMDGVVHLIDEVLFPPLRREQESIDEGRSWLHSIMTAWSKWVWRGDMSIEELMERLRPYSEGA